MLRVVAAFAAVGLAAPATALIPTGPNTPYYAGPPPSEFIREGAALVLFVHPGRIDGLCGGAPAGMVVYACVRRVEGDIPVVIMPHPVVARGEVYADILTHELAHREGWAYDHPMPVTPEG